MHAFIIYLFKVSCWVAIWWLLYLYFLRKETFFTFNRIYLMSGLAVSLIIPLLKITYPVEIVLMQSTTTSIVGNIQASAVGNSIDIYSMLFYLYVFCGMLLIIRQLFLLLKMNSRLRSGGFTNVNNYRLVDSPDVGMPFSFFNYIFFNSRITSEQERQLIFAHEHYHINQRHWIDLAVMECISIFLWFNPFVWLYRRSVQENHEYLADKAVINNGFSPVYYRAALINQSMYSPVFPFVNSFANYKFKRISMMKKENSNPLKKLAVLLLVPAAGFFLWAFAEPDYRITTIDQQPEYDYSTLQNDTLKKEVKEVVVIGYGAQKKSSDTSTTDKNQEPVKVIGSGTLTVSTQRFIIDGIESDYKTFKGLDPNNLESVSILKDASATAIYGEKSENGVLLITTKKNTKSSESSSDNKDNDFKTSNYFTVPVLTQRYIIDGIESDYNALKGLDPERIESITVLKDASAIAFYGENGKNGVILITTKKAIQTPAVIVNEKNQLFDIRIRGTNLLNSFPPLIIIDEVESTENALKELKPDEIESITILKNDSATSVYGEKAKNGVILITTKKNKEASEKSVVDISG